MPLDRASPQTQEILKEERGLPYEAPKGAEPGRGVWYSKTMREAMLYKKLEDEKVRCRICAHRCLILPGKTGICGVRKNIEGTLYCLNYRKAIAANIDPIEKKPLFHFRPGTISFSIATAGCNFHCAFCQNWDISQFPRNPQRGSTRPGQVEPQGEFPGFDLPPKEIVEKALENNCASIAYTYTEPTIFFEYTYDTAKLAQKEGLKNVLVTNGYQTPETITKMAGLIDAVNIDLKSFRDGYYREICGARLEPVLETIKLIHQAGIWVELTTLVVPKQNDSEEELAEIAEFIAGIDKNIPWHISRFHPDYEMTNSYPTPLETLEEAAAIGKKAGLNYIYLGNTRGHPLENTSCPRCGKIIIERFGYHIKNHLKGGRCLHCSQEIPGVF